jgi:phosphoribosyl-dephospho-CoA transferase
MTPDERACEPEVGPHTLVRIRGAEALSANEELPPWVGNSLRRAPWVVVRRTRDGGARIPVGVRGESRAARFAAFTAVHDVLDSVTPQAITANQLWRSAARRDCVPAVAALPAVAEIMRALGLGAQWGPTGSVGFELVCGQPTAHRASDLDLAVQLDAPPSAAIARALHAALCALSVRADVLFEMPHGAVALADCAGTQDKWLLRTPDGPRWISAVPD